MSVSVQDLVGTTLTLAQWDAIGETEQRYELVQGVLTMAASEMSINRRIVTRLLMLLDAVPGAEVLSDMDVLVDPDGQRPTVRCPDLAVMRRWPGDVPRLDPADLVLLVEVVSPSSGREDWVRKRAEYAEAGIPAYLVIDRLRGEVGVYTKPGPQGYREEAVGAAVDVPVLGEVLRIDLDELAGGTERAAEPGV